MASQDNIELQMDVLDYKEDSFKGSDGSQVEYNYALVRVGGSVVKMTSKANLYDSVGETVVAKVAVRAGQNLVPKLMIIDIK